MVIINQNNNLNTNLTKNSNSPETDTIINIETNETSLSIDPYRCRGCGKCMKIDSEHFELNGNVATVISQENLNSSALSNAISACRDSAIILNS